MKLLFWNLGRKDNKEIAKEAIVSKDVDIAIFAEYGETDCNDVANRLGSQYKCYDGYGGCDKICLIAKRNYSVVVNCEATRYRRFYNPVIDCISEENKSYGSYYYATGINSLYWYSFDQALFRKTLISTFDHIEYLKSIADYNLLTENGIPNKTSDHLPLYIEMR